MPCTPPSCFIYSARDVTRAVIKHHGEFQGVSQPVAWWQADSGHWQIVFWSTASGKLELFSMENDRTRVLTGNAKIHFAFPAPDK